MKLLFAILLIGLIVSPAYAQEQASEKRLNEVARRGAHVMPFDLELTTHIFTKTPTGGIQQVIVKNRENTQQLKLIRQHLSKISNKFQQGDFSGPAKIHGKTMPGLERLSQAKHKQIDIAYKDLVDGAEITFSSNEPAFIKAIHQYFDAQLSDHARHAVSMRSMHHKTQHSMHQSQSVSEVLTESGTDMFATIQEVIQKLSADPNTNWSKVNLETLRQHLRDMFEFSYNVDVLSQQAIERGVKIRVKPVNVRAEKALDKVLSAHPMMLKMETGWAMQSTKIGGEYQIIVTTAKPSEIDKIRGLGYIGLLAIGNHHQPHHWAMAKGQNPHHKMHH